MRTFTWLEMWEDGEPLEIEATEDEIIENYYPHWVDLMRIAGKAHLISYEACLEDFITVFWATEIK